jgi:hypothetical protein
MNADKQSEKNKRPGCLEKILKHCHIRHYPEDFDLFRQGDCANRLVFVLEGSFSAFRTVYGCDELPVRVVGVGGVIGGEGYIAGYDTSLYAYRAREFSKTAELTFDRLQGVRSGLPRTCDIQLLHLLGEQVTTSLVFCLEHLTRLDAAINDVPLQIDRYEIRPPLK